MHVPSQRDTRRKTLCKDKTIPEQKWTIWWQKRKEKKQIYPFKLFLKLKYFGHSIVRTKGRRTKEIKKKIIINFRQSNHSLQG